MYGALGASRRPYSYRLHIDAAGPPPFVFPWRDAGSSAHLAARRHGARRTAGLRPVDGGVDVAVVLPGTAATPVAGATAALVGAVDSAPAPARFWSSTLRGAATPPGVR